MTQEKSSKIVNKYLIFFFVKHTMGDKNTETFRKDRKCLINLMYLKALVRVSDLMENIICSYFSNCHNNGVISWV